ncbi:hypothetical protein GC722_02920 [Auraticoccus sp. F435]|uniref:Uncharacterized protein n=1 Tax=Auraticoccus cholistanensis TaxID=2656650 RepID=A0A6A9UTS4_9ACTN|nr:hypothetical protein [Auraticoccus cholistanensis]MVA74984.1 hypothetical protein [Auraticoccus cholistanensis]
MKILSHDSRWSGDDESADDTLIIATTREELATMAAAINEALEAVEEWEFGTRLGVTSDQARALRDGLSEVLRTAHRPK